MWSNFGNSSISILQGFAYKTIFLRSVLVSSLTIYDWQAMKQKQREALFHLPQILDAKESTWFFNVLKVSWSHFSYY